MRYTTKEVNLICLALAKKFKLLENKDNIEAYKDFINDIEKNITNIRIANKIDINQKKIRKIMKKS